MATLRSKGAAVCVGLAFLCLGLSAPSAQAAFGFLPGHEGFNVTAVEEDGSPATRAGSHPYALSTELNFNLAAEPPVQPGGPYTDGDLRELQIELPPGLIENPAALAQCTQAQFHTPRQSPFQSSLSGESCPDQTQIGVVAMHTSYGGGSTRTFGVFNLVPPPGAPSQFGFSPFGVPITFTPHVREANGEYGLTLSSLSFSQLLDVRGLRLTIWGTPGLLSHDDERGNCLNEVEPQSPFGEPGTIVPHAEPPYHAGTCSVSKQSKGEGGFEPPRAYLTLPSTCAGPIAFSVTADSWQQPGTISDAAVLRDGGGEPLSLTDCRSLITVGSVRPNTERASSAAGLEFNLEVDNGGLVNDTDSNGIVNPEARAPSPVKKAVVTLPQGVTINPSVAAGLGVCSPTGYAAETVSSAPGAGCPNASKIGEFTVQSPLFEETVKGAIFLAQPYLNPFQSLTALYLVAKAPQRGILVKVAGELSPDPTTGQLTASFDDLPQLPYSELSVHFRAGQRSPLATPDACGVYAASIDLSPWLDPTSVVHQSSSFQISKGIGGEACPPPVAPFTPQAKGGTLNSNAGSYTPFYLHLTRTDAEQEITSYSATLPPGLLGKIAGIPYCPEADIEAAKHESGVEETEHPSCPAASEIGHTYSGYGLGAVLAYAPGGLYLAGPYHGSAFSIVAIDSATVGPFDLGVIVVRSAIRVNPRTAQVSIDSAGTDPIPHIIKGIPIHLRDVRVYISRPETTINPTSCEPFALTSTLTGSSAPFTNPVDATGSATDHFQVSNCSSLGFAPKLALKLKGATKRGDYPALTATVTARRGDANIGSAAVTLPHSEFLEQGHIGAVCTKSQLERGACPPGSTYGHASASTPLLAAPMQGPVYLATGYGHTLPDLVAVLHGGGITIDVDGRIDSVNGGLRGTFEGLPDAPVSKFVFSLDGGKRGLLVNERNICTSPETATARFVGQNNRGELLHPKLQAKCVKQKKKHR